MNINQDRIQDAIERINAGEILSVVDASSYADGLCIGDFRQIGWSKRMTTRYSMWYDWNGPVAIKVDGKVIQPGGSTEEVDMDWT